MFLKIFQDSQENNCDRVSFSNFINKETPTHFFPVNFAKYLEHLFK